MSSRLFARNTRPLTTSVRPSTLSTSSCVKSTRTVSKRSRLKTRNSETPSLLRIRSLAKATKKGTFNSIAASLMTSNQRPKRKESS